MERRIVGARWEDKITNEEIREKTGVEDIGGVIKKLKWTFARHVARVEGKKWDGKIRD